MDADDDDDGIEQPESFCVVLFYDGCCHESNDYGEVCVRYTLRR